MRYHLFGESHGPAVGVLLEAVPPGLTVDMAAVRAELARRAPGRSPLSSARCEADTVRVLSGLLDGVTTGAPLCALIDNSDARPQDYAALRHLPRPGHADYAARVRYQGCNDPRGGGHFSGRLTAPLVFAGALAKQFLARAGVAVYAHLARVAEVEDVLPDLARPDAAALAAVAAKTFPVLDEARGARMQQAILSAAQEGDSVGGVIQCLTLGLPVGLGEADDPLEGRLARALFAVPAVKGVAFGTGFALAGLRGSLANDALYADADGRVRTRTNHNGGINGGISNGMPLVFSAAIKPTPSIRLPQETVDLHTFAPATLRVEGRHDPCIAPRAVPVIEAVTALVLHEALDGGCL